MSSLRRRSSGELAQRAGREGIWHAADLRMKINLDKFREAPEGHNQAEAICWNEALVIVEGGVLWLKLALRLLSGQSGGKKLSLNGSPNFVKKVSDSVRSGWHMFDNSKLTSHYAPEPKVDPKSPTA